MSTETVLKHGQTLVFIGDSITDCGRREGPAGALGSGYVKFFSHLLAMREPAKAVRILNTGIGGNTAEDLFHRWADDVLELRPDWVAIKIGINDCNRFVSQAGQNPKQSPERFHEFLEACLKLTADTLPQTRCLMITPFYLSRDQRRDSYRGSVGARLVEYQDAVRALAGRFQARLLDAQAVFATFLATNGPERLSQDMVHLNELGALILAEGVYQALGA